MFNPEDILNDRYQLKHRLGQTSVGHQTWLVTDLLTEEKVTIKLLAFSPEMRWEELKLFEREAQILQELNHPRIPQYRDYFDIDKTIGNGVPWFVLVQDYIAGNSLQDLLAQNQTFTETQVYGMATEILEILIYLHELPTPVLHRDIKPSNLILGEDNHIYLIDFGAVQAQAITTGVTFTIVGTSGYAPLEQFWGRTVPASDLYALGMTLIHLLTGVSPIDLPQQNSRIQFSDKVSLKPHFQRWLETLTDIALENRFVTARDALNQLQCQKTQLPTYPKFRKIFQPYNSRIKLVKTSEKIEIDFPSLLDIDVGNPLFSLIIITLSVVSLVTFPFSLLILLIFFNLFKKSSLSLDEYQLLIHYQILGFTYYKHHCQTNDIMGVFIYNESQNRDQVKIRTHSRTYALGRPTQEAESLWLAQELQSWLYKL